MPTTVALTCERCGMEFQRQLAKNRPHPRTCSQCPKITPTEIRSPNHELALRVVNYRLAIEMATSLLETGRPAMALAVLRDVEAPARVGLSCRRGCGFVGDTPRARHQHERQCAA